MIADVAEFVTDNAGDFVAVERVKEPSRRADGSVLDSALSARTDPLRSAISLRLFGLVDIRISAIACSSRSPACA